MNGLQQVLSVTLMGLRAIPQRLGASLVIVVGMASVAAVTTSILSMSTGLMRAVNGSGRADRAIVLSQGSRSDFASAISRDNALTIADAPGVKKTAEGKPIVSSEALASVEVVKKGNGLDAYVPLHGVGPQFFALHPEIKLTSGRLFRAGTHELIVGKSAQAQFEGLDLGSQIALSADDWTVTGSFESNGDLLQSALIADSETVLSATRHSTFNSVTVLLDRQDSFALFKTALTNNPTLGVDVVREPEFLTKQWQELDEFLTMIAYVVGGIMGVGAVFAAMNTMYSAVSSRSVEIATLRALGFGAGAVVASLFAEALLLALSGASIGAIAAWAAFNGDTHTVGGIVFNLAVTPALMGLGVSFAFVLGFVGCLFPASRAATLPVALALRGT